MDLTLAGTVKEPPVVKTWLPLDAIAGNGELNLVGIITPAKYQ
jgi:hypothetical protein